MPTVLPRWALETSPSRAEGPRRTRPPTRNSGVPTSTSSAASIRQPCSSRTSQIWRSVTRLTIIRTIVDELEDDGYVVHTRLVDAPDHGIPQRRQRLLVVAIDSGDFNWPSPVGDRKCCGTPLPTFRRWPGAGGPRAARMVGPSTPSRRMRAAMSSTCVRGLVETTRTRSYDHITRPVRDGRSDHLRGDGLELEVLGRRPEDLRRYRHDIFDDKYKRLDCDEPSRSHHGPHRQGRLLVHPSRPAPHADDSRGRTHPDLSRPRPVRRPAVGGLPADRERRATRSRRARGPTDPCCSVHRSGARPGLECRSSLRTSLVGSRIGRISELSGSMRRMSGPLSKARYSSTGHRSRRRRRCRRTIAKLQTPRETTVAADRLRDEAHIAGRAVRAEQLVVVAAWFEGREDAFESIDAMKAAPHVGERIAEIAALIGGADEPVPVVVSAGTIRVASRVFGDLKGGRSRSDGRLAITRSLGAADDDARMAMAAVIELAAAICRPANPDCGSCPLESECAARGAT